MIKVFYGHVARNLGDLAITYGLAALLQMLNREFVFALPGPMGPASTAAFRDVSRRLGVERFQVLDLERIRAHVRLGSDCGSIDIDALLDSCRDELDRQVMTGPLCRPGLALFNSCEHLFSYASDPRRCDIAARILPLLANDDRVGMLPGTYGPFEDPESAALMSAFLGRMKSVPVREYESRSIVEQLAPSPRVAVEILLDPAYFCPELYYNAKVGGGSNRVLMVPRMDQFGLRWGADQSRATSKRRREHGFSFSKAHAAYTRIGERLLREGYRVSLLAQTKGDEALCDSIAHNLQDYAGQQSVAKFVPETIGAWIDSVGSHGMVLTSRFHTAIAATALGIPVVGVYFPENGHKMPGLFQLLGISEFAFRWPESLSEEAEVVLADEVAQSVAGASACDTYLLKVLRRRTIDYVQELVDRSTR